MGSKIPSAIPVTSLLWTLFDHVVKLVAQEADAVRITKSNARLRSTGSAGKKTAVTPMATPAET